MNSTNERLRHGRPSRVSTGSASARSVRQPGDAFFRAFLDGLGVVFHHTASRTTRLRFITVACAAAWIFAPPVRAAEAWRITADRRPEIRGKEVDWIDGDYALQSDTLVMTVGRPVAGRDANMTVRGVGAALIDLTSIDRMSDQLSAFYPTGGRYQFTDEDAVAIRRDAKTDAVSITFGNGVSVRQDGTTATVRYTLRDGDPFISVRTTVGGFNVQGFTAFDGLRADHSFEFSSHNALRVGFAEDDFFRQTYGFLAVNADRAPRWSGGRMKRLYPAASARSIDSTAPDRVTAVAWTTRIYAGESVADVAGMIEAAVPQTITVDGAVGEAPRIRLTITDAPDEFALECPVSWSVADDGVSRVHLPAGRYAAKASAIGHVTTEVTLTVPPTPGNHRVRLGPASSVNITTTDDSGEPCPAKVTFYGKTGTTGKRSPTPRFGPDTADGSVMNCLYTTDGVATRSIPPGTYDVLVSRGPEFDVESFSVTVPDGMQVRVDARLKRVVDTGGYVSAELHSHSSPSGDTTASQRGRIENLLCEHIEFAPCTEHQRIDSYASHLRELNASGLMATCSGIELTGALLPVNHQNAFPLEHRPHQQNGGGPRASSNPVAQIQRLAMWDDGATKVVQINHPSVPQLVHDRDADGTPDGGYAEMLDFTDVMEVHPPERIFAVDAPAAPDRPPSDADSTATATATATAAADDDDDDDADNRIVHWLQLIKSGRRIPGVVNTDAHYNHHGSGWLRNWIASDSDSPAEISIDQMIANLKSGRAIMSTGPFLRVTAERVVDRPKVSGRATRRPRLSTGATPSSSRLENSTIADAPALRYQIGDAIPAGGGKIRLAVTVQCANWMDVNRVEIFVDGARRRQHSRTRRTTPDSFSDDVEKFNEVFELNVDPGSFIVVATIGQGMRLGRVMGEKHGSVPPVAVSNPIYVD